MELQDHGLPEESEVRRKLSEMARVLGLRTVATNSVLCLEREQHEALEVLGCIRTATRLADADHPRLASSEYHFKSAQEMRALFRDDPESCDATLEIAARCQAKIPTGAYFYPSFPLPPGFADDDEYLAHISREGLRKRWPEPSAEALARLEYELAMMKNMKVAGYMLIVADFMRAAREMGIPVGPGRGSAVGSLVAYATEITAVDPLKYALLFERFLNPERISMPEHRFGLLGPGPRADHRVREGEVRQGMRGADHHLRAPQVQGRPQGHRPHPRDRPQRGEPPHQALPASGGRQGTHPGRSHRSESPAARRRGGRSPLPAGLGDRQADRGLRAQRRHARRRRDHRPARGGPLRASLLPRKARATRWWCSSPRTTRRASGS